jgi:hypothetical protein
MSKPLSTTKSKSASKTTSETKESTHSSISLDLDDVAQFISELSSSETDDVVTPLPPSGKDDTLSADDMMGMAAKSHQRGKSASAVGAAFPGSIGASRSDYTLPSTDIRSEIRSSEDFTTELKLDARRSAGASDGLRVRSRSVFNLRDFVGERDAGVRLAEDWGVITDPDATQVLVRGDGYLKDKVKVKSLPRICPLVAAECWKCDKRIDNIAGSKYRSWYSENIDPLDDSVFVVVVHLQVESIGACFIHYHILEGGLPAKTKDDGFNRLFNRLVQTAEYPYYGSMRRADSPSPTASVDSSTSAMESVTATKSVSASMSSDDSELPYRNDAERAAFEEECMEFKKSRLKLIPKLVKGPFLVKRMVQNTPCILGRAVPHKYYRGRNYLEIDAQVDESYMSATILKLCHSYSTQIVVDMYWTIEGVDAPELPEHVMLGVSLHNIDFSKTTELSLKTDKKKPDTSALRISSPRGRKR